ncbi:MAG: DUF5677 domain-containing protein [Candidatus Heimdallarchaeum aukensis]|uniref:DUF5677 domain-containing protein n=1 Tax=Candidatus Heimdallarchaeum aukensis TaxID=2876573 RepID=A0A9Y1BMD5_9ARCH|nr:MAG: DUF5677 domain-containing protein [Candidatus Heimdallarchaeum aukensis]
MKHKKDKYLKHKRYKKHLISPLLYLLGEDKIIEVDWSKKQLPEFLWVASLFTTYDHHKALYLYRKTTQLIQKYLQSDAVSFGLVSEFSNIPLEHQKDFLNEIQHIFASIFIRTRFEDIMNIYQEDSLNYLFNVKPFSESQKDEILDVISNLIIELYESHGDLASLMRVLVLMRMMEERKIIGLEQETCSRIIKALSVYPQGDKKLVESSARSISAIFLDNFIDQNWSKKFWMKNGLLSPCIPSMRKINIQEYNQVWYELTEMRLYLIDSIDLEINQMWKKIKINIYNPSKEDIVAGLISRLASNFQFFSNYLVFQEPSIGYILLRNHLETYFVLKWLLLKDDEELYAKFKEYGYGEKKNEKMKLEEYKPKGYEKKIKQIDRILTEKGLSDLIKIKLTGSWADKTSIRKMAEDIGDKKYYDLFYGPTAGISHSDWSGLTELNTEFCINPLHGLHKIPKSFGKNMFDVNIFFLIQEIYYKALSVIQDHYNISETIYSRSYFEEIYSRISCLTANNEEYENAYS